MNKKQIVVITNGFVLLGEVEITNQIVAVKNASVIRVWGTTKGLGEIALGGPTPSTVLDPCGDVEVERSQVIMRISCEA